MASARARGAAARARAGRGVVHRRDQRWDLERIARSDGSRHGPTRPGSGRSMCHRSDRAALGDRAPFAGPVAEQSRRIRCRRIRQSLAQSLIFGLVLLGALIVLLALNFVLFALELRVNESRSLARLVRELFL